ncbi:MAG: NUDIX hydrolase [Acidimicrobiia bacterium]|nr:NUDIX hydrolase [Acidimicrobiia bacterium]
MVDRTNRELSSEYRRRAKNPTVLQASMPYAHVPISFLIHPEQDLQFDVHCSLARKAPKPDLAQASERSDVLPFSWDAYARWRGRELRKSYYGPGLNWGAKVRLADLPQMSGVKTRAGLRMRCAKVKYEDYLLAEGSVHLEVPGQLPYLREFFEGSAWTLRQVDLPSGEDAAAYYSMMVGVSTLVTTADGFIVLQRRSDRVQAARGGVGCSSGGAADWGDLRWWRRGLFRRSLRTTMYRETREELGLGSRSFYKDRWPFLGAAFNLRYGRDLNFYAHLKYKKDRAALERQFHQRHLYRFGAGKDRWEIAHLVFLDPLDVVEGGELTQRAESLLGDARHARGAIYALEASGRLAELRQLRAPGRR